MTENIHIVGGTYYERCDESQWDQLYGSGFRAAAAICRMCKVTLSTYLHEIDINILRANAQTYDLKLNIFDCKSTFSFVYQHALAAPIIVPPLHTVPNPDQIFVKDNCVLRFGFLKGIAKVEADYAVYDPQSAFHPEPFHENGSRAKKLAIIANYNEAQHLSAKGPPDKVAQKLQKNNDATVVVVKCGNWGAFVCDGTIKK